MTISPLMIYLASAADGFALFLFVISVICFFVSYVLSNNSNIALIPLFIGIFILLVSLLMPSEKTIYKMMIIPKVVNSPIVQKLPDEIQKYIDKSLGEDKK